MGHRNENSAREKGIARRQFRRRLIIIAPFKEKIRERPSCFSRTKGRTPGITEVGDNDRESWTKGRDKGGNNVGTVWKKIAARYGVTG